MPKSDRRIILSAVAVIGVAIAVIFFAGGKDAPPGGLANRIDSVSSPESPDVPVTPDFPIAPDTPSPPASLFPFDPNTADSTALLRLGLARWQVRNIYKYRAAGGIYRKKEDFAQLYGLTVKQYRELEPYITIGADYQPAANLFADKERREDEGRVGQRDSAVTRHYPIKLTDGETIDLATADTTQLQRVPGIGPYYAKRIVDYGQRLGGYVSLSQLDEIDGFPHEALNYITLSEGSSPTSKLNVNTLSVNELKRHPYINFYQARAIVDYRRQNGIITDIGDLRLLPDFGDEAISRLRPYVTY